MLPISVCMIAKNEERNICSCLAPLKELGLELIVVDTGSTDQTKALVRKYTDLLFDFTWGNDFSAARNYSITRASHDWILVVDFDEYLQSADIQKLASYANIDSPKIGTVTRINPCRLISGQTSVMTEQVARFFNRKYNHYQGIIHEQVFPKDHSTPDYFPVEVSLYHHGYEKESSLNEKAKRNLTLLLTALKKSPHDPYLLFQTGKCYQVLKDYAAACRYFDKGLSYDIDPSLTYVQEMIESYGYCLLERKEYQTALGLANVYELFARQTDFVFLMGLIYMNNALFEQAVLEFQKASAMKPGKTEGINSYLPNYNIGVIYECAGEIKKAQKYYNNCGDYLPAQKRLQALSS